MILFTHLTKFSIVVALATLQARSITSDGVSFPIASMELYDGKDFTCPHLRQLEYLMTTEVLIHIITILLLLLLSS